MNMKVLNPEEAETLKSKHTRHDYSPIYMELEAGNTIIMDSMDDDRLSSAIYHRYRKKLNRPYHIIRLPDKTYMVYLEPLEQHAEPQPQ